MLTSSSFTLLILPNPITNCREEQERRLKKMRERLLKEEVDLLRGGRGGDEGDDLMVVGSGSGDRNGDKENRGGPRGDRDMGRGQARQRPSGPGRGGAAAVQGNMRGHDSDDDSEVDDDDLDGPRGGGGGRDSDEELSVGPGAKGGRATQAKVRKHRHDLVGSCPLFRIVVVEKLVQ